MEIHHHPKHLERPRQWKEYLSEVLIIFVAITGSFFAENLREHLVDKHKSKEYMERLLQDLKSDTLNLTNTIRANNQLIKGLDSLEGIITDPNIESRWNSLYDYSQKYAFSYFGYNPVNTTITQLLSTGNLRLIQKKAVADEIVNYDKFSSVVMRIGEFTGNQLSRIIESQADLFDFISMAQNTGLKPHQNQSMKYDKKSLNAYYFIIKAYQTSVRLYNFQLEQIKQHANSFIRLLKEEYRLDEN